MAESKLLIPSYMKEWIQGKVSEPSTMTHWLNPHLASIWVLFCVLAVPPPIQFPGYGLGKQ